MELRPGYKQTEIGVIPDEWESVPFSQFVAIQRGHDLTASQRRPGAVPVMGSAGQNGFHDTALAKGPGVVLGRSGASFGQAHWCEVDFWPHNTALYVTDFFENDRRFAYYALRETDFSRHNSGGAQQSLNRNFIASVSLARPPRFEQVQIRKCLDDVDASVGALSRLIAKKRDLRQGAMHRLLTGQTRLPGFSGGWQEKRLGEQIRFQVGFPFRSSFFNKSGLGVRLIRNRDLKSNDEAIYYNGDYGREFIVRCGDLLVSMDGEFILHQWKGDASLLNQRVGRILGRGDVDINFLLYYLAKPLQQIELATSSTTVKHLSHGDVEGIEIPLPSATEQAAIARVLTDTDAEISALEVRLEKICALKQAMMQALLTGKVRLPTSSDLAPQPEAAHV